MKCFQVSTARISNREIYFQPFLGSDFNKKFLKTVKLDEINDSIARPGYSLLFAADRILQCLQVRNDLYGGHWSVAVVYITAAVDYSRLSPQNLGISLLATIAWLSASLSCPFYPVYYNYF